MPIAIPGNLGTLGQEPIFSAYLGAAQITPASAWVQLNIDTEEFDPQNAFSIATKRFMPQVAGYYRISGAVAIPSPAALGIAVYKNGAAAKYGNRDNSSQLNVTVDALIYLNGTTDYVELWCISAVTATLIVGANSTYFQGNFERIP